MNANLDFIKAGKRVIAIEREALTLLEKRVGDAFAAAGETILACKGRVVVIGMGKSGHIGRKIAATMASTGTPAFFVHPAEASHGDLGMITGQDVVVAISFSGKTPEIVTIIPVIKRIGAQLIGLVGDKQSPLALQSDIYLDISVRAEACSLGLAPTASTAVTLALGDALAIAMLEARGYTAEDFAQLHPGGALGKRLLTIKDIMHGDQAVPLVSEQQTIYDTLTVMTEKKLGMTAIVDAQGKVCGVYTDGDIRRTLQKGLDIKTTLVKQEMTSPCRTVQPSVLVAAAIQLMERDKINGLLVVDEDNRPIGAFNMQDLLRHQVV